MSIPRIAVNRPVTIVMLVVGLIVLGAVSIVRLPLTLLPDLNFPAAAVIVEYPNVGPWEVESQVTKPIEEVIATVSNVTRVSSMTEMGSTTIVAEFNWGTDMDFATLEMRERLDLIQGLLPSEVERPQVFKFDPSINPIFQFNISSDGDISEVRRLADDTIKKRLERIEGVASVTVEGGREREIRVELDQQRLDHYNISIEQVQQAIAAGNINFPGGEVTDRGREFLVRTIGEFVSLDEIADTVVHAGAAGMVRVSDVGTVTDTFKPEDRLTRLNGAPSVSISLQKESEANTVQVSNAILDEVKKLQEEYGDSLDIQVVWDDARIIRSSISSVIENGIVGGLAAMVVLFVFLGSFAPTIVVGIAIPVAAIATFFFLYIFDVSLNMLSLGGLALGIGMLVDNAIVSLENIARHRQLGLDPKEASAMGAQEIMAALFASTLTTVAVFLPVVFVGGLAAEIFSDLSLAVTFSLVLSLVVAVTFVPMMATRIRIAQVTEQGTTGFIHRMQKRYGKLLEWALNHRWWVVGGAVILLGITAALFPLIGREFLPAMDTGEFNVRLELPHGTPTHVTDSYVKEMEAFVASIPEVETVSVTVEKGLGELYVGAVSVTERKRSLDDILEDIRAFGRTMPGAKIQVVSADVFGLEGGLSGPISVLVKGPDMDELRRVSDEIAERIRAVPGTREVDTSLAAGQPELQIRLKRDRMARYGLTVAQVASAVRVGMDGVTATRYRLGDSEGQELDVTVQLAEQWRYDAESLEQLLIETPLGINVRLGEVADIVEDRSPVMINREGNSRVVRVYGHVAPDRDLSSVTRDIERDLQSMELPEDVSITFGGDIAEMEDAFDRLDFALLLAIVLVYMILAAQFESLSQPFIIMFSVPMAFVGVVAGLLLTGRALSVPAMIGIIMLAGIVVNNAIVLIDFINQLVERGEQRRRAIVEGSQARLRPVLMTTLTTVLGMLPLALGLGEGAELQAPIATVVIGGLTFSTVLTLGLIPTLYDVFADMTMKISEWRDTRRNRKQQPTSATKGS